MDFYTMEQVQESLKRADAVNKAIGRIKSMLEKQLDNLRWLPEEVKPVKELMVETTNEAMENLKVVRDALLGRIEDGGIVSKNKPITPYQDVRQMAYLMEIRIRRQDQRIAKMRDFMKKMVDEVGGGGDHPNMSGLESLPGYADLYK